ncbi:MAG: LuxR family maltose regulon positive regulatory protein [Janthinobacterium sp.]|jgi:LuxR family maltose regulon positive regulatory protein
MKKTTPPDQPISHSHSHLTIVGRTRTAFSRSDDPKVYHEVVPDRADLPGLQGPPPSKSAPPANARHLLTRHHLLARMLGADAARLIVLQAPAGFGKSTVLRSLHDALRAQGKAVAWLTLDAGDNDPELLAHALARARRALLPGAASDAGAQSGQLATVEVPFVLILDEFEQIHGPAALLLVQQSIEALGVGQQIVIGSRERPSWHMGRLRARQQLLECGAADLRFSLQESTQFLLEKRQLNLTAEQVQALHDATDGWAAALWLASLAL